MPALNDTHDPRARSWVESANVAGSDFPVQNLPFAVFRRAGSAEAFRGGVAIGEQIVDLAALHALALHPRGVGEPLAAAAESTLNRFMSLGAAAWSPLRRHLFELLRAGSTAAERLRGALVPQSAAEYALPARIGDYTDFYASIHHATAVGRLFRPDQPLLPNYRWVPVAYHGRASSVRVSPQSFVRPLGQRLPPGAERPVFGPSTRLDYELEVGAFIGPGNALGRPIPIGEAENHVFGLCLLNDWSARDIQAWEYQPLGPFLAKNFATTISPWIVTLEALAPYRLPWTRGPDEPQPLANLDDATVRATGAIDLRLEAFIDTERMRAAGVAPERVSSTSFRHSYWTLAQMVAHHSSNGCNLEPGDLLGSGTQSGPGPDEAGSLLEITAAGRQPLRLGNGETRSFLADGDRVICRGACARDGFARIGFGAVAGTVLAAPAVPPSAS
jgi:fumarylacetoacetase